MALKVRWLLGNTSFLSTALFYKSQAPQVFGSIAEVLPAGKKWGWQHQWHPAANSHLQNFIFMDKQTVNAIPTQLVFRDFLNADLNRLNSTRVFSKQRDFLFSCRLRWRNGQLQSPGLLNSHVTLHHNKKHCKKETKNPGIFWLKVSSIIFSLSSCLPDTTEAGFYWYITMQTGQSLILP